jgi:hypothetical protein
MLIELGGFFFVEFGKKFFSRGAVEIFMRSRKFDDDEKTVHANFCWPMSTRWHDKTLSSEVGEFFDIPRQHATFPDTL